MVSENFNPQVPSTNDANSYERFLLAEYDNIAQAHFNTKNSISSFFKHYLLIVSLPLPILAIVFGKASNTSADKPFPFPTDTLSLYLLNLIPFLFMIISIVGILVMLYIVNLDLNASLYARTVNGIRGYFTKRSGLRPDDELKVRVLPADSSKPRFTGFHSIIFVVLAFAFIDSFYFALAVAAVSDLSIAPGDFLEWGRLVFCGLVFVLHILLYLGFARRRERQYSEMPLNGADAGDQAKDMKS